MVRHLLIVSVVHISLLSCVHGAIFLDRTDVDIGFVYRDEPQRLVFEFENTSDDTVHILGIEPSCDCTTGQAVPEAVGPHGHGKILVFFDPMGYEERGPLSEYLRVMTTDRSQPEVLLTFSAEVGIGPEPEPRALKFGKICGGKSDTLNLAIHPAPDGVLGIVDAYSDTACVLVERIGSGTHGEHEFRVIATNKEGCGRVACLVTFVTTDSLREEIRVPVSLSLIGKIVVEPDIIAFGPTLPGTYVAQAVKIYTKSGLKFTVREATCSVEYIEPQITPVTDSSCELRLLVKDGSPPGRVAGEIRLVTDCPNEPALDIKVTGYVRSTKK